MATQETKEKIEKTVDVVDETISTLERIPKVNLNGTTKSQQVIILGTVFAVGAIAGPVVVSYVKRGFNALRRKPVVLNQTINAGPLPAARTVPTPPSGGRPLGDS